MKALSIQGYRWFNNREGNTYHTVMITIDDETVHFSPITYGYSDCYVQTAQEWLEEKNHIPKNIGHLRIFCENNNIDYSCNVQDVKRKRDLT